MRYGSSVQLCGSSRPLLEVQGAAEMPSSSHGQHDLIPQRICPIKQLTGHRFAQVAPMITALFVARAKSRAPGWETCLEPSIDFETHIPISLTTASSPLAGRSSHYTSRLKANRHGVPINHPLCSPHLNDRGRGPTVPRSTSTRWPTTTAQNNRRTITRDRQTAPRRARRLNIYLSLSILCELLHHIGHS
jgi:hypothetical protein